MRKTKKQKGGEPQPRLAEAQRRIDEWIAEGDVNKELDINGLNLTSLPPLPENLKILFCEANNLTELSDLPDTLIDLFCGDNKLSSLPSTLPANLDTLACMNNELTSIPTLPKKLRGLSCSNNKLTRLPHLPMSLLYLDCDDNKLPKEYSRNTSLGDEDFDVDYFPRYIARVRNLQQRVDDLQSHSRESKRKKFAMNLGTHKNNPLHRFAMKNIANFMGKENIEKFNTNSMKPSNVEFMANKNAARKRLATRKKKYQK
jgi:Leucine-rich repeat (LRR) protein